MTITVLMGTPFGDIEEEPYVPPTRQPEAPTPCPHAVPWCVDHQEPGHGTEFHNGPLAFFCGGGRDVDGDVTVDGMVCIQDGQETEWHIDVNGILYTADGAVALAHTIIAAAQRLKGTAL